MTFNMKRRNKSLEESMANLSQKVKDPPYEEPEPE